MVVTVCGSYGLLLVNLMLRVYALYKRDSRVILTLVILLSLKILLLFINWFYMIPNIIFTETCAPRMKRSSDMVTMACV